MSPGQGEIVRANLQGRGNSLETRDVAWILVSAWKAFDCKWGFRCTIAAKQRSFAPKQGIPSERNLFDSEQLHVESGIC
jgi:predicted MarR family transcription regulator